VVEHDVGNALQGLEFSAEDNAPDAINAVDASTPDERKTSFGLLVRVKVCSITGRPL
jgi:hypothetical protein